jgi:hypothetical protein
LKIFNQYFKVLDHFLEIKVSGKRLRIKLDIEGRDEPRMSIKETEYLYPVGSEHCKMFRVIEKKNKTIFTAKKVTLNLMDPGSYKVFLSCVNEALFLSSSDAKNVNFLLKSKGKFKSSNFIKVISLSRGKRLISGTFK